MRGRGVGGERGQDTIEYVGVLAVVAAVIALVLGVVDDGLAKPIKNGVRYGKPPMSAQQVQAYISAHPGELPPGTRGEIDSSDGISDEDVAIARNPSQILEALQDGGHSSGSNELEALGQFELRVAEETHPKTRGQALVALLHPIGGQHGCTAP